MRANRRDFVAGIVFLGGILAVGYMTVVIHGFSALVGPRLTPLEVHFPDVAGLEVGEEVRAKGVKVGQVASVSYRPDGHIGVGIRLFSDPRLREGCAFHVRAKSPLGGNYVDIDPGPPGAPLTTADTFAGEHPTDLFAELGKVLGEKRDTIMAIIDNLGDTTQALREGRGTLGALVYDSALRDDVTSAVSEVSASIRGTRKGLLHALLSDEELAAGVRGIALSLHDALGRTDSPLGILLYDKETGAHLKLTLAEVAQIAADLRAGKGTLGSLLADDALYLKALDAADGIASLTAGEGVVPYLLTDPESRERGREILLGLSTTVAGLNEGDGTLAQLIHSPELYSKLRELVVQLREAVEDAREHAPVNQLINLLGAVF